MKKNKFSPHFQVFWVLSSVLMRSRPVAWGKNVLVHCLFNTHQLHLEGSLGGCCERIRGWWRTRNHLFHMWRSALVCSERGEAGSSNRAQQNLRGAAQCERSWPVSCVLRLPQLGDVLMLHFGGTWFDSKVITVKRFLLLASGYLEPWQPVLHVLRFSQPVSGMQ